MLNPIQIACVALSISLGAPVVRAQQAPPAAPKWSTTQPRGTVRDISFTTTEGTWMSVSVTPDEKTLIFDHLDQICSLPITGGEARVLTADFGIALNFQPAVSPDGRTIAFISDRGGQNNLWLMDIDGGNPRAIDQNLEWRDSLPTWTPDGRFLVVRRYNVKNRGERKPELWLFSIHGGKGMKYLAGNDGASEPSLSFDGRFLYYSVVTPTVSDVANGHLQLRRLDLKTGDTLELTRGLEGDNGLGDSRQSTGGGFAPRPSPDGRYLAFAKRTSAGSISFKGHLLSPRTALFLRDLESGSERLLIDPMDHDSVGAVSAGSDWIGTLPAYAWSASSAHVYFSGGGKLHRADVGTGHIEDIPFTVSVRRNISEQALGTIRINASKTFQPRFLRWPAVSPDAKKTIFEAAGQLWIQALAGGSAKRLLLPEFKQPQYGGAWSPDGKTIAFTAWDEDHQGHVWRVEADGTGLKQLTTAAGEYQNPVFSADGSEVIFVASSGATQRSLLLTDNTWYALMRVPSGGGTATRITYVAPPGGMLALRRFLTQPSVTADGRVVYPEVVKQGTESLTEVRSIRMDGTDLQRIARLTLADEATLSPDGHWLAFEEGDRIYLTELPAFTGGQPISILRADGAWPARLLSPLGGNYPRWVSPHTISFISGDTLSLFHVENESGGSAGKEERIPLRAEMPNAEAAGTIAFRNARLITMHGKEVIERGDLVITDGRIAAVGAAGKIAIPPGAKIMDARGTTIMPGMVDMHAHNHRNSAGLMPVRDFELAAQLAYGVTTSLDPSTFSQNVFPHAERIEAGVSVGPRTFSSGDPLFGFDTSRSNATTTYAEMEQEVVRQKSWGVVELKQYMTPQRAQRQWVTDAARKLGVRVSAEGGDLFYDLGMIMDGQTGWEHPIQQEPLFDDAVQFLGRAHAFYSPTLVVGGPGPLSDRYWREGTDLSLDPKLSYFLPQSKLEPSTRVRPVRPFSDYTFPIIAQGAADIVAAGGNASIGSHGQQYGIAAQWELWMLASAMSPHQALETATMGGARMLGAEADLGSLEPGKLGDLLVLESNPLEDIHNSAEIRWVMLGGVLRSAKTLDQVWPQQLSYGGFSWQKDPSRLNDVKLVK